MKLRTSYFNAKVLRKDITRFCPVWALYGVFLVIYLMALNGRSSPGAVANSMIELFTLMTWTNLFYGFICAGVLFGDLFHSRMCNALHAMPMRREGWFLTHLAAGILFALVPNGIFTLITGVMMEQYYYIALIWLAVMMLQYLFFFSLGVFSAMCAGNRLAMTAIYGIINFFSAIVYWLATLLYEPLLYGVTLNDSDFTFFCPAIYLTPEKYVLFTYGKIRCQWGGFIPENWCYLFAIAGLGVILLVASMLIYRRRKLESAGDFISLRPCAPVFLVILSLVSGAVFYALAEAFDVTLPYFFLVFGMAVGFFIGRMLLDRTVKVFRLKSFLGFAVLTAVLLGSLLMTRLDPMGIIGYVPPTEQIDQVQMYLSEDRYNFNLDSKGFTDEESIQQIRQLHKQLLVERSHSSGETCEVYFTYRLKNGTTVSRQYWVAAGSDVGKKVRQCFSQLEYILRADDVDSFIGSIVQTDIQLYDSDKEDFIVLTKPEQLQQLFDALKKDAQEGTLAQSWIFHPNNDTVGWISFVYESSDPRWDGSYPDKHYLDLHIFDNCTHTVEFFNTLAKE